MFHRQKKKEEKKKKETEERDHARHAAQTASERQEGVDLT